MKENNMLKAVLNNLSDILVVEDSSGNVCYQNHPEIDRFSLEKDEKNSDEFFDTESGRWYKLSQINFDVEESHFILKKYGHITKMKKQQSVLEVDGKTGLLRSEAFKEKLHYLSKLNKKMVFVLIDIDYFKKINDFYGHDSGDEVLSKIGLLIKSIFRNSDLLGRFGGDEFILSLVDIDINKAIQRLEILRNSVTNIALSNENSSDNVTISIGCLEYDNNLSYEENLKRVDVLLYISKENGKNQINSSNTTKVRKIK